MKTTKRVRASWRAALALTLIFPAVAAAQEHAVKAPPLISHEELQKKLADAKIRLLDSRPRADYEKGHIPGALWVNGKTFSEISKTEHISDQAAWSQALAPLGIGADTEIFIIGGPRQDAARIWWTLSYAGAKNVGLVDGGFPLWEKKGFPVTSEVPAVEAKPFKVEFHARRVANRSDVETAITKKDAQIVDVRSPAEYRGEKPPPGSTRAGHIPGAHLLETSKLVDADGKFLDHETVRKNLSEAGIVADRPVIVYSNTGSRGSLAVYALRRLGIHTRVYYQGFADWAKDAASPIVTGDKPGELAFAK